MIQICGKYLTLSSKYLFGFLKYIQICFRAFQKVLEKTGGTAAKINSSFHCKHLRDIKDRIRSVKHTERKRTELHILKKKEIHILRNSAFKIHME